MIHTLWRGLLAGAVGTVAINMATYVDMALRGRPSSNAPAQMASKLASMAHLPLSQHDSGAEDETAQHRASGLGALLGYVNGLGMGVIYGVLRSQSDEICLPLAGTLVGLAAMAASDVPLALLKVSNPKTWKAADWLADLIPHLIYGCVTVVLYEDLIEQ